MSQTVDLLRKSSFVFDNEANWGKAELIADLNEMCEEVKLIRAGKLKGQSWEDFKREVYIPTKN